MMPWKLDLPCFTLTGTMEIAKAQQESRGGIMKQRLLRIWWTHCFSPNI